MTVKELDNDNFKEFIGKGRAVIDFHAPWCGPCQMMGPVFEELSSEFEDISFGKVNTQEEKELASLYQIMSIPCLVVFEDGKESERIVGFLQKEQLKDKINSIKNKK